MLLNLMPASASGISVSVTSTASAAAALPGLGSTIRIVNEGPNTAFIAVGNSSVAATVPTGSSATTCTAVLAGEDVVFSRVPDSQTYISAITRASPQIATLSVYVSDGM